MDVLETATVLQETGKATMGCGCVLMLLIIFGVITAVCIAAVFGVK